MAALPSPGARDRTSLLELDTTADCLSSCGQPDLFLTVFSIPGSSPQSPEKLDLWIYAKYGIELVFRNGHRIRLIPFYPPDGGRLLPGTRFSPSEFLPGLTQPDMVRRFGQPHESVSERLGPHAITRYTYKAAGGSSLSLSFLDGRLSGVSAGFCKQISDPGLTFRAVPAAEADLTPVLGTWLLGNSPQRIVFSLSRHNRGFLEGQWYRKQSPLEIVTGSFDRKSGYLDFLYRWQDKVQEGHGRFILSPGGGRLIGDICDSSEAAFCELVRGKK